LLLNPLLHLVDAVVAHGGHGSVPLLAQLLGIKAGSGAEGGKQAITVLFWAIALGKTVEHLDQTATEKVIQLKACLMAQEVELDEKFVHHAPIQGGDYERECQMESALAIGNGESNAHSEQPEVERP
jgi:hypothetical protein